MAKQIQFRCVSWGKGKGGRAAQIGMCREVKSPSPALDIQEQPGLIRMWGGGPVPAYATWQWPGHGWILSHGAATGYPLPNLIIHGNPCKLDAMAMRAGFVPQAGG